MSNIKTRYRILKTDRIHQGDILKDFNFPQAKKEFKMGDFDLIDYKFFIILSQDCDLDGASKFDEDLLQKEKNEPVNGNKFLPSILISPLFEEEQINKGTYLSHLNFKMDNKGRIHKTKWRDIINNNNPRYHYLEKFDEYSKNHIMDFKIFYSVPYEYLNGKFEDCYYKSLNELFREDLSNRFFNYHSRIGLPPLKENK